MFSVMQGMFLICYFENILKNTLKNNIKKNPFKFTWSYFIPQSKWFGQDKYIYILNAFFFYLKKKKEKQMWSVFSRRRYSYWKRGMF